MKIERIGGRGVFFTFGKGDSPFGYSTSVYLINTAGKIFICDTHTGPKSMEVVKKYIKDNGWENKAVIIFNSHSDWDHIWGNCAFRDAEVISHKTARKRMLERGAYDLERLSRFHNGKVELRLPNITFEDKMSFEDEEIDFIYAPGHTVDSAICFDKKDSVLFAGDLLEYPVPNIGYHDLQGFLDSLNKIRAYSPRLVLSGHSGVADEELLEENIRYIRELLELGAAMPVEGKDEEWQSGHLYNIKNLILLRDVDRVREKQGAAFDYRSFKQEFWSLVNPEYDNPEEEASYFSNTGYEELEAALSRYMDKLSI